MPILTPFEKPKRKAPEGLRQTALITDPNMLGQTETGTALPFAQTQAMDAVPKEPLDIKNSLDVLDTRITPENWKPEPMPWEADEEARAEEEKQRQRERVAKKLRAATELNDRLTRIILASGDMEATEKFLSEQHTAELLARGEIGKTKHVVTDSNVNALSVSEITKGEEKIRAYVKPQRLATTYGSNGRNVYRLENIWDEETQNYKEEQIRESGAVAQSFLNAVKTSHGINRNEEMCKQIMALYGMNENGAKTVFSADHWSSRLGIPAKHEAVREMATSLIARFLHMDIVPPTTLRKDADGTDIASVQAEVVSQNPNLQKPIESHTEEGRDLLLDILKKGKDHPGADSFIKLATLHYLIGALDGERNVMWDGKKFQAIDNGLSFGISYASEKHIGDKTFTKPRGISQLVSLPVEIVQKVRKKDTSWKLDEQTIEHFKHIVSKIETYLSEREKIADEKGRISKIDREQLHRRGINGEEAKFVFETMAFVFENGKIAPKEAVFFIDRLKQVIAHGGPPPLEAGIDYIPKLHGLLEEKETVAQVA